jgi:hypothetical protein
VTLDVTQSLASKSDQLNNPDLAGGPVVVEILGVRESTGQADKDKQPYEVLLSGGLKPWRPCKTMRRLLSEIWGTDAHIWIGHWIRLYRDPSVKFGPDETGGIRFDGADIEKNTVITLPTKRGQYSRYQVAPIKPPASWLADLLAETGLTIADLDAHRAESTPPKLAVSTLSDDERNKLCAFYRRNPAKLPRKK